MSNHAYLIVEDVLQQSTLQRVIRDYKPIWEYHTILGLKGNGYIKKNLKSFNTLAESLPTIIITDLDNIDCPVELTAAWFNFKKSRKLIFRIAVREIESWLLADRHNFSRFIGVPINKIPENIEDIENPKGFLNDLAKKSRKKEIRENLVAKGTAKIGPGYNSLLEVFIFSHWNPERARISSKSLNKAIIRIQEHNFFAP